MNKIHECFDALKRKEIKYTLFKSNTSLPRSFSGKTDFDMLVLREDKYSFIEILHTFGFKRRDATYDKKYVEMEDFVYYDETEGVIHHFHVHYKLIFGSKYKKIYSIFNVNDLVENKSCWHNYYPVRVLEPEYELALLVFRIILKTAALNRAVIVGVIKQRPFMPGNIKSELDDLLGQCDMDKFYGILNDQSKGFYKFINAFICLYADNSISRFEVLKLKYFNRSLIDSYRVIDKKQASFDAKLRKMHLAHSRRWLAGGGLFIGFVGCDGSGKSTVTKNIDDWLSYKLSVDRVYLGRIKGDMFLYFIRKLSAALHKLGIYPLHKLIYNYSHVYVANRRYRIFMDAKNSVNSGSVVISDRYPLREFWGMDDAMDGPRVTSDNKKMMHKERDIYRKIDKYPDLLFVMNVSIETSVNRKPEHENTRIRDNILKKINAVNDLPDSIDDKNVYFIDANRNIDLVMSEVKCIIWKYL